MGVSKDEILACGMPALFVQTLHDNFTQKTSTSETISGAVTFASSVSLNGNTTIGNATADTLTVNATPTFSSPVTVNGATTFNSAVTFAGTANATFLAFSSGGQINLGTEGSITPVGSNTAATFTISETFSVISTSVADTNDAVVLPAPTTGQMFIIYNAGGASANIFAGTGRTVNGAASAKLQNGKARIFIAQNSTTYWSMLGA